MTRPARVGSKRQNAVERQDRSDGERKTGAELDFQFFAGQAGLDGFHAASSGKVARIASAAAFVRMRSH